MTGDVLFRRPSAADELYYVCKCGAYCGADGRTQRPYGRPAGPETRRLRGEAHRVFDLLWREKHMTRDEAYFWLATATGLTRLTCHIGLMDQAMLRRTIQASSEKLATFRDEA